MFANNETAKKQYEIDKKNEEIIDEEIKEIIRHTNNVKDTIELMDKVRNYKEEINKIQLELKDELEDIYQTRKNKELTEIEKRTKEDKEVIINSGIENYIFDGVLMNIICGMSIKNHMYPYTNFIKILERLAEHELRFEIDSIEGEECVNVEGFKFTPRLIKSVCIWYYDNYRTYGGLEFKKAQIEKLKNDDLKVYKCFIQPHKMIVIKKYEKDLTNLINSYRTDEVLQYYKKELTYWQEKLMEIDDREIYIE
jgi:hypothetical protein